MAAYTGILQGQFNQQAFNSAKNIMKLPARLPVHIQRKIQTQTSKQNAYRSRILLNNSRKPSTTYPQRALSIGKKFIQAGGGDSAVKMSKLRVSAGQLVAAFNQTNDDILKKIIQTKQKLPSLPKLKLPSFPRFVLTQRVVNAQDKDVVACDAANKDVQLERKTISMDECLEREEHNLEKAVHDANKDLVVYTMDSAQSPELVRERLGIMKNQIMESNEKKTSNKVNGMDVYKKLAMFAAHLPNINKLKEIDFKKLMKNRANKETLESPVREEYDLETSILNTYLSARMTTLPEETLETLDAIQQSLAASQPEPQEEMHSIQRSVPTRAEPQPTKKESSKVVKLLSKAAPSRGKGKDKNEKVATSTKIVISQSSIDSKTKALVYSITNAQSEESKLKRVDEFCKHLSSYPEARHLATKMHVLSPLLRHLHSSDDENLQGEVRKALALVGYAEPVKGRGVRILSIDGGGSRGIVAIESLRELEKRCGKPIHEMFDFISCVSSGAVLACLLAFAKVPLDVCENLFQTLTKEVFQRSAIVGTGHLVWSHSFYNTDTWVKILKA